MKRAKHGPTFLEFVLEYVESIIFNNGYRGSAQWVAFAVVVQQYGWADFAFSWTLYDFLKINNMPNCISWYRLIQQNQIT